MNEILPPERRTCLRCNRTEVWDEDSEIWTVEESDGSNEGREQCVHEWDITGNYNPFEEGS